MPVKKFAGVKVQNRPDILWQLSNDSYVVAGLQGIVAVAGFFTEGWGLGTLSSFSNVPNSSYNFPGLCTSTDKDKAYVVFPVKDVDDKWYFEYRKCSDPSFTWSAASLSPELSDGVDPLYGVNSLGPRWITLIPSYLDTDVFTVMWADIENSKLRWHIIRVDASTDSWTGYFQLRSYDVGAEAEIFGIQHHSLVGNAVYEGAGLFCYRNGASDIDVYIHGYVVNGEAITLNSGGWVRSPGDGSNFPLEATPFISSGFASVADPVGSTIHLLYVAKSESGLYDVFIYQPVIVASWAPYIGKGTDYKLYQAWDGGTLGKVGFTADDGNRIIAMMQIWSAAPLGGDPQNVFGCRTRVMPDGSWDAVPTVWENFCSLDSDVRFAPHFFNGFSEEGGWVGGAALVYYSSAKGGASVVDEAGLYFYKGIPDTSFVYSSCCSSPLIFPEAIDISASPLPPGSPPPGDMSPSPIPVVTGDLEPKTCPGNIRQVVYPVKISEDSSGWIGALAALGEKPQELSDEDLTYVEGLEINGALGLEFPVSNLIPYPGEQAFNIIMRHDDALTASVAVTLQYAKKIAPGIWTDYGVGSFLLTGEYQNYVIYVDVPVGIELELVRALIEIATLVEIDNPDNDSAISARIRLSKVVWGYCATYPAEPPSDTMSPRPMGEVPGIPSEDGETLAFIPEGGVGEVGQVSPSPLSSPQPGTEILRPNRDVLVKLFQKRPVYMRLNESVLATADDPIYAPVLVEEFEDTNELRNRINAHLEVALTDPRGSGPWGHLQLRMKAARSRPPDSVIQALALEESSQCSDPEPSTCGDPAVLKPYGVDEDGSWQQAPLNWAISESYWEPDGIYINSVVTEPPGEACIINMQSPPDHEGGWRKISLKLRARARSAKEDVGSRILNGIQGNICSFNKSTANLPPGAPDYEIRWEPNSADGSIQGWKVSDTQFEGTIILRSNQDIDVSLYLMQAEPTSNIRTEVSLDGIDWADGVRFDLLAYRTMVVHYRFTLNYGGSSPTGNHAISLLMQVTGPELITPIELAAWPPRAAFVLSVYQGSMQSVPLESRVRLRVRPSGNFVFSQMDVKNTITLTSGWLDYNLEWEGFWDRYQIRDLRFDLQAIGLSLTEDVAHIDVDLVSAVVDRFCPGFHLTYVSSAVTCSATVQPVEDVTLSGWSPSPAWSRLLGDPELQSSEYITCDPLTPNTLLLGFAPPVLKVPVLTGYSRTWRKVEVWVQGNIKTVGSTRVVFAVSTNYGAEKRTEDLESYSKVFVLTWEYEDGLTKEQIERLRVQVRAVTTKIGKDEAEVRLRVVQVRLSCKDTAVEATVTPLTLLPTALKKIDGPSSIEVYSCGSIGSCGSSPTRKVATIIIRNIGYLGVASVIINMTGKVTYWVENGSSQTLVSDEVKELDIYAQVGATDDPFPDFDISGVVHILLTQGIVENKQSFDWFYAGSG